MGWTRNHVSVSYDHPWSFFPRGRGQRGFTLVEILVVISIVAVLAAIAIPVTVNQLAKSADSSSKASLTSVSGVLDTTLLSWNGVPNEALNLCNESATYPVANQPSNTCPDGQWSLSKVADGAALNPPVSGDIPSGVRMQGRMASDGSYCIDAWNTRYGSTSFHYSSSESQVQPGSCFASSWAANGSSVSGGSNNTSAAIASAPPTGVAAVVDSKTRSVTVSWDGIANQKYSVKISGYAAKELVPTVTGKATCLFPAGSCSGPASSRLSGGTYTASVRIVDSAGLGPASNAEFKLSGTSSITNASVVDIGSEYIPVATITTTRTNHSANPSFESTIGGYAILSSGGQPEMARVSSDAYSGTYSFEATKGGGLTEVHSSSVEATSPLVQTGLPYTASVYAKVPAGQETTTLVPRIYYYDAAGNLILAPKPVYEGTSVILSPGGSWTRLSATGISPANAKYLQFAATELTGGTAGKKFLLDGMNIEQTDAAGSFFDGNTSGASWTGTKNMSASTMPMSRSALGRVKVSWTIPDSAVGQSVTYLVTSNPGSNTCTVVSASSCYVSGLDSDTTYTFTVKATTKAGAGASGVTNSVTTPPPDAAPPTPPGIVTGLAAQSAAVGRILLSWTAPADKGGGAITGYVVERSTNGNSWTVVQDGTSVDTSFADANLTKDQEYMYRVSALNAAGSGPVSDIVKMIPGYPPYKPVVYAGPYYVTSTGTVELKVLKPPNTPGFSYWTVVATDNTGVTSSFETQQYTYHTETSTLPYTYHSAVIGYTPTWQDTCDAVYTYWDGFSWNVGHYGYPCTRGGDPIYGNIKDGTPAGYTDNGTAWVKNTQVKDNTPSGWSDDGSQWTRTTTSNLNYTEATYTCTTEICTISYPNYSSKLGTKWWFYLAGKNDYGWGPPLVTSINPPTGTVKYTAVSTLNQCPDGYPIDMGNGNCQVQLAYTYHSAQRWAHIGWNYYWGCSCGGTCGNWSNGDPYCRTAQWGWETYTERDGTPSGWLDNGSYWYKESAKLVYSTYRIDSSVPLSDQNNIDNRYGAFYIDGVLNTTGSTPDLGRCGGTHTYEYKGIGGSNSGSITLPCN